MRLEGPTGYWCWIVRKDQPLDSSQRSTALFMRLLPVCLQATSWPEIVVVSDARRGHEMSVCRA
eukprot:6191603-Pleurochrysis_carterae.AAC.3